MNAIPPVSRKHQPRFDNDHHRTATAQAYLNDIEAYDLVRPHYPTEVLHLLDIGSPRSTIADVGCGTGIFTNQLAQQFPHAHILGIDPSQAMLRAARKSLPTSDFIRGTAENTALQEHSIDLITCAQTWHWVDHARAAAEATRIAAPNGRLFLVWNTIDVSHPWAHRLTRIMHSGDTLAAGFYPTVGAGWQLCREERLTWSQALSPTQVHLLMHTRSYWQQASAATREKMTTNLQWYLHQHLGHEETNAPVVEIPYRTDAFVYRQTGANSPL